MRNTSKIIYCLIFLLGFNGCKEYAGTSTYLSQVLENLEQIESANYTTINEAWAHGDTTALRIGRTFVKEIMNHQDTTIGASFMRFDDVERTKLNFAYDGHVRVLVYHDVKGIVVDDFTSRQLPFRPVSPPFFNHVRNIISYALQTTDSIEIDFTDLGDQYHMKLTIHEETQVEFFGTAHHIPENPYNMDDPTSVYEVWIDKSTHLPFKVRREMSHDISVTTCIDAEINMEGMADFDIYAYLPDTYEIRAYGQRTGTGTTHALLGKPAPDWVLQDINGREVALADLSSKVLLINFTGIGCGPCQASIPFLNGLKDLYRDADFMLIAIETWVNNKQAHQHYIERHQINYMFLGDSDEVVRQYHTGGAVPVFFILDQQRIVRKVINGYSLETTGTQIMDAINELI